MKKTIPTTLGACAAALSYLLPTCALAQAAPLSLPAQVVLGSQADQQPAARDEIIYIKHFNSCMHITQGNGKKRCRDTFTGYLESPGISAAVGRNRLNLKGQVILFGNLLHS